MTWTILVLILAIALYMFGGKIAALIGLADNGRKLVKSSIKVIAIVLIAGSMCRLWTPTYLVKINPGILQEMANEMQKEQAENAERDMRKYIKSNMEKMVENAPVMGNEDAKKTIFLFSAHSCSYCGRVHSELLRVLEDRDDVRVVLKNFSIHGVMSDVSAKATIAAKIQSNAKAVALDTMLFERGYYTQEEVKDQSKVASVIHKNVMKLAKEAGLDISKLEADMEGEIVAAELRQVREIANRFQVGGTPFLIIGNKAFPGAIPYSQIMEALK